MKFYYNADKVYEKREKKYGYYDKYEYFTEEDINEIEIYELAISEDEYYKLNEDENSEYYNTAPIVDYCECSYIFAEFKVIEEAKRMLLNNLNYTVYCTIYDI